MHCVSSYEGKECHSGWKFDKFEKYVKKMKAIQNIAHSDKKEREFYVNKKCNHAKNEVTYFYNKIIFRLQNKWFM
jgi:hypothetical protein